MTPSQAEPWKVSTCKPSGISGASDEAGTGQCAKSKLFHRWEISQRPGGNGRGSREVRIGYSRMARLLLFWPYNSILPYRSRVVCS